MGKTLTESTASKPVSQEKRNERLKFFAQAAGRGINRIITIAANLSALLIAGIMLLTAAEVVLRYFFNAPIKGSYEISEMVFVGAIFLGVAYTQMCRQHVRVDLLLIHLSSKTNIILESCMLLITLALYAVFAWEGVKTLFVSISSGEYRWGLIPIPLWPARLMVPLGLSLLCLRFLEDLFSNVNRLFDQRKGGKKIWTQH